jgi:hypothetical protein
MKNNISTLPNNSKSVNTNSRFGKIFNHSTNEWNISEVAKLQDSELNVLYAMIELIPTQYIGTLQEGLEDYSCHLLSIDDYCQEWIDGEDTPFDFGNLPLFTLQSVEDNDGNCFDNLQLNPEVDEIIQWQAPRIDDLIDYCIETIQEQETSTLTVELA